MLDNIKMLYYWKAADLKTAAKIGQINIFLWSKTCKRGQVD